MDEGNVLILTGNAVTTSSGGMIWWFFSEYPKKAAAQGLANIMNGFLSLQHECRAWGDVGRKVLCCETPM